MIKVENSPDKRLTSEQIEEVYDIDKKYLDEFKGMLQGKFITEITGGYFSNTTKGRLYAHLARFLKEYFKLGPGG